MARRVTRAVQICLISTLLVASARRDVHGEELIITPANLPRIGSVDERLQSYNIEMVEVTGGRFWKPYGSEAHAQRDGTPLEATSPQSNNADTNSSLYEYRPPIDLTNSRLRRLAAALAPAYVRISGTWANATHFATADIAPSTAPGFNGVLSQRQWREVVNFSRNVGAQIVTSFATSPGTRDASGAWQPDEARRLLDFTRSLGGVVAAAEFMNEPDLATTASTGDGATAYGRDFKLFRSFMKKEFPDIKILGPGSVTESNNVSQLLTASGPGRLDIFSYHYYATLSERCVGFSTPAAALSEEWLSRTDQALAFNRALRDRFEPGRPIWLTETAAAACGGNRWDASFLDTFRYLDQLGRLARASVQVVMHNTLAASDYGLVDERTLTPRPNYWGALLWHQLMGNIVLDGGVPIQMGLHVYAHCLRGVPGGVSLLVINNDAGMSHSLTFSTHSQRYTLDAATLQDTKVRLNEIPLELEANGDLPQIKGIPSAAGTLIFAPETISFIAISSAANSACH